MSDKEYIDVEPIGIGTDSRNAASSSAVGCGTAVGRRSTSTMEIKDNEWKKAIFRSWDEFKAARREVLPRLRGILDSIPDDVAASEKKIRDLNISLDMDVVQADGGTRCASINGGVIALIKLLKHLVFENKLYEVPDFKPIAAVSVGIKNRDILVDIDFSEDSTIDADINIVSDSDGNITEVTGFAEESSVPKSLFLKAIETGIEKNFEILSVLENFY